MFLFFQLQKRIFNALKKSVIRFSQGNAFFWVFRFIITSEAENDWKNKNIQPKPKFSCSNKKKVYRFEIYLFYF